MRLIKTGPYVPGREKLEIIQKWGKDIPDYAILSHTWGPPDDEVLLADVQNGVSHTKPAFSKLLKALDLARFDGYGWLWIDTCCIDKASSVELSEAINSMYAYYVSAKKCYAYLRNATSSIYWINDDNDKEGKRSWWRRGWTLQELLAPKSVEFYSGDWTFLGTKSDLRGTVSQISGIDEEYLTGDVPVQAASIAKRMSWASARGTTREEDLAYALIGLFGVNMPMLYGEGGKQAFIRLQQEIMSLSEDQSLFAWAKASGDDQDAVDGYHGLLADCPKDFERSGATLPYSEGTDYNPSTMTARGVRVSLPLTPKADGTTIAALQCPVPSRGYSDWLAVYLQRFPGGSGSNQYARVNCGMLASVSETGRIQEIYVRQHIPSYTVQTLYPRHYFQIRRISSHSEEDPLLEGYQITYSKRTARFDPIDRHLPNVPKQAWSGVPLVYKIDKTAGALSAALLIRRVHDGESFVMLLGAQQDLNVGFLFRESATDTLPSFEYLQGKYQPRSAPARARLAHHDVQVSTEEVVRAGQKIYLVDIDITAFPLPTSMEEVLQDAVDFVTQPILGREGAPRKADLRNKVKRLWA